MRDRAIDSFLPLIDSRSTHAKASLLTWLKVWRERAASRKALAELDRRMLKDIGIDKVDADKESQRPFWQGSSAAYWRQLGGR